MMLDTGVLDGFLSATVRVATPLLLAALGEMIAERGGVINLGVEGAMLAGALAAALGASTGGAWSGLAASGAAGVLLATVFGLAAIGARADQIIAGTATTLLAVGITGTVYQAAFGSAGAGLSLPTLAPIPIPGLAIVPLAGPAFFNQPVTTYVALLAVPLCWWFLFAPEPGWRFERWENRRSTRARPVYGLARCSSLPLSLGACSQGSPAEHWCWHRWARSLNA